MELKSRYDDPEYRKQVANQMLATPTLEIACRAIVDLRAEVYERGALLGKANAKISDLQKDSDELNRAKKQLMNAFTGGRLFPGEKNED